jgi:hypothetical protein
MGKTERACHLFWTSVGASTTFILWTVFLVLKIDNAVQWSWIGVFVPLWLSFFFFTYMVILIAVYGIRGKAESISFFAWVELAGIAGLLFSILLPLKLQLEWTINWGWIFFPLWVSLFALMLVDTNWPNATYKFHRLILSFLSKEKNSKSYPFFCFRDLEDEIGNDYYK